MLRLSRLRLEGFFGIHEVEIDLDGQGLVLVAGVNGSGKTALVIEGLFYSLYGQSFEYKKVPGDKVVNWRYAPGHLLTEVGFFVDKEEYLIRRSRGHSVYGTSVSLLRKADGEYRDLSLGSAAATQSQIDRLLGVTAEGFSSSVIFSSDLMRFPDFPDDRKKRIVDDLVHLSEGDAALALVKDDRMSLLQARTLVARDEAAALSRVRTLEQEIKVLTEPLEAPDPDKIEASRAAVAEAEATYDILRKREFVPVSQVSYSLKKAREAELQPLHDEARDLAGKLDRARRALKKLQADLAQTDCPTCRRPWDEAHMAPTRSAAAQHEAAVEDLSTAVQEVKAEAEAVAARHDPDIAVAEAQENEARARATAVGAEVEAARRRLETLRIVLREQEKSQARILGILEERDTRLDEKQEQLAEAEALLASARDDLGTCDARLADLQELMECFGPKGARVALVQSIIPILNDSAARIGEAIAPGISVTFAADEETKGSLQIEVDNARGAKQYRGNSAGERRRVDLIVLFTLMTLRRVQVNLLAIDEAFEKLSEDSQRAVAEYLKTLTATVPTIFMVNHTATAFASLADQVWTMDQGKLVSREAA